MRELSMLNVDILNINPEIVYSIIEKIKVIHAKEEPTFEETAPNSEYEYDGAQILADHSDDLTANEIARAIENLEQAQKVDLLTLFYVGRGDYEIEEWSAARLLAKDMLAPDLSGYLLSKPMASDYLARALELLNCASD